MYKIYLADRRKIYFIDDSNFGSHKCIERGKFKHFEIHNRYFNEARNEIFFGNNRIYAFISCNYCGY